MSYRSILAAAAASLCAFVAALANTPAHADSRRSFTCFGNGPSLTCIKIKTSGDLANPYIRTVPEADDDDSAEARDRRWVRYCRPVIRPDAYGVPTYHYARPGCEYGRTD
jgi:hypothetical protein